MIDLSKQPEEQEIPKKQTPGLFGTTYESMLINEMLIDNTHNFNEKEDVIPIEREVRRLKFNSRRTSIKRWHGMSPDPNVFDKYLGKICGIPIDILPEIIEVMFESMCFMPPSLVEDIIKELNKNEYEHINRCHTCHHFREDGCYLKGYKQAKNPQDFCSSHSSYTHGSDNQPVF